jgi:hypothetical protein
MTFSPRAHARAAVIAVALVAHGVYALPLPEAISSKEIRRPGAQADLAFWQGALGRVGVEVTTQQLGSYAIDASRRLAALHHALKAPFAPVFDLVGANQSWALFASATTRPERLVVEIQPAGSTEWTPLLRRLDPCCTWREAQLEYRRIRGVWDGQDPDADRPGYKGLAKWIARQAFAEHPEAERVRVSLEQAVSRYPWQDPDPTLKRIHERVVARSEVGP